MTDQLRLFAIKQENNTSDDYYTPKWIFDALKLNFDMDVASPPHETNVPCKQYFSQLDDGLSAVWEGLIWMNPPFSKPAPWVAKFLRHNNGIALLPASKSNWFIQVWNEADLIVMLPASTKFEQGSIMLQTCLISMGDVASKALQASNIGKTR